MSVKILNFFSEKLLNILSNVGAKDCLLTNKADFLFEKDYWGLVNYQNLKKIYSLEKKEINIGASSFTDLNLSKKIFEKSVRDNFIIVGQMYEEADYIVNNFQYEIDTRYNKKYEIPDYFTKIHEIKLGNIRISEIYKKIK